MEGITVGQEVKGVSDLLKAILLKDEIEELIFKVSDLIT